MATIKFRLKSKVEKKGKTIYVYLSNGRGNMFEVKSGFSISPQDWHIKSGFPKQNNPTNKNIHSDLKTLEAFIHDSINSANSEGVMIDKFWLDLKIIFLTIRKIFLKEGITGLGEATMTKFKGNKKYK